MKQKELVLKCVHTNVYCVIIIIVVLTGSMVFFSSTTSADQILTAKEPLTGGGVSIEFKNGEMIGVVEQQIGNCHTIPRAVINHIIIGCSYSAL